MTATVRRVNGRTRRRFTGRHVTGRIQLQRGAPTELGDKLPPFPKVAPGPPSRPYLQAMQILAALFFEGIDLRSVAGGATHIDLTGIQFSAASPTPTPVTWSPHLAVVVRCPEDHSGQGVLEVVFTRDGEQIARNVQPLSVEPGRFGYRLVRAELEFEEFGTVEAHCRVDQGPATVVPFTLLPPPDSPSTTT